MLYENSAVGGLVLCGGSVWFGRVSNKCAAHIARWLNGLQDALNLFRWGRIEVAARQKLAGNIRQHVLLRRLGQLADHMGA